MAKTRRMIEESISLVDCVAEILDARVPGSSRNPVLDELCSAKPRILLLNKSDLADESVNGMWVRFYSGQKYDVLPVDCKTGKGVKSFLPVLKRLLNHKIEKSKSRGMKQISLRVMVAGIPNVGKSAFINRLAGSKRAKTEDRPGVTRNRQWIPLGGGIELMDTPGILWPKFEDPLIAEKLAFTGAVKDEIIDIVQLASRLCETLAESYKTNLAERYRLPPESFAYPGPDLLNQIGKNRGMLLAGGKVDLARAAVMLLDEFRGGKLGRISLEKPPK